MTRLTVLIVVLAVLAVVADRVSAYAAGRVVASDLTSTERLGRPAAVTFSGVPFLTQALRGNYDDVTVTMERFPTSSGVVVDRIDAHLHGVSVPPGELIQGRLTALPVRQGDADAFLAFGDLEASARSVAVPVTLTLARAAADRVAVAATVTTPLGRFTIRGQARLSVTGGTVSVQLLPETITGVPAILRSQISGLLDLTRLVPPLPFGFKATAVTVQDSGLQLQATGTGLSIPA